LAEKESSFCRSVQENTLFIECYVIKYTTFMLAIF